MLGAEAAAGAAGACAAGAGAPTGAGVWHDLLLCRRVNQFSHTAVLTRAGNGIKLSLRNTFFLAIERTKGE